MAQVYLGNNLLVDSSTHSDQVIAAAFNDLEERVETLEAGGGGSGGSSSFDPTDINSSISDISTRVQTIESNYLDSDDISTFVDIDDVSEFTYSKALIDASIRKVNSTISLMNSGFQEHDASLIQLTYDLDDVSTRLSQSSGADLTNYYTKTQTDASLENYAYSKSRIDASFAGLDASMNFIYDYAADVSARVGSGGGGGSTPDLTNYATKSDISTFKPIQYVNLSTYEENVSDGTIDQDTMYVITDLADSDELATLITVDDLSTYKATILSDVSTTADQTIANANTSINSIKTTAISAVLSQQTTSVNAVNTARNNANTSINTAKTNAIRDISNYIDGRVAEMKNFLVISDASYNDLQTIDPNTIYFITD